MLIKTSYQLALTHAQAGSFTPVVAAVPSLGRTGVDATWRRSVLSVRKPLTVDAVQASAKRAAAMYTRDRNAGFVAKPASEPRGVPS